MKSRISSLVVAGYLLLCIFLGGSSQGAWSNLALQLTGVAVITWSALAGRSGRGHAAGVLNLLLSCALLLVLLQLVPLPTAMWTSLPGRKELADAIAMLGSPLRPFTISESPYSSVMTLFAAIPAIAAFIATERLAPSQRAIALTTIVGMAASVFIGAVQVAGGRTSWAYFYQIHNPGAIGFFANANHMATLLLVGIPMATALLISAKPERRTSAVARYAIAAALLTLIVVGIILNGSRAALGLSIPVILASAALFPRAVRWRGLTLAVSVVALLGGIALIVSNPLTSAEFETDKSASTVQRGEIWSTTAHAIEDNFLLGTGLGTFESVYHRYEDPAKITQSYVNHAHNDYLEFILEFGAGGLLVIAAFLIWWSIAALRIWASPFSTPFARAATIATATILAHSAVDFPLRTSAISAIFAACLAIMAQHLRPVAAVAAKPGEARPTRHVNLG